MTTGAGLTGLAYNTASLTAYYRKGAPGAATAIALATQTVGGAFSSGGFVEIDAINMPGMYRFDIPNLAIDTAGSATLLFKGATNMAALPIELQIITPDLEAALATPTNITAGTITTATDVTTVNGLAANVITAASIAADAITGATVAADVTIASVTGAVGSVTSGVTVTTNNDKTGYGLSAAAVQAVWDAATTALTTVGSVGKKVADWVVGTIDTYTGNTKQTGDNYVRLGAPAGASIAADLLAIDNFVDGLETTIGAAGAGLTALASQASVDAVDNFIDTEIADIQSRLPAALVGGRMDSSVGAIANDTDAVTRLERVLSGNTTGTVGAASSTTSIVTSALSPAAAVIDQFKGKIVSFDAATTTANLRGQSTDITASTALGVLTVTALSDAPVSGDTFTVS